MGKAREGRLGRGLLGWFGRAGQSRVAQDALAQAQTAVAEATRSTEHLLALNADLTAQNRELLRLHEIARSLHAERDFDTVLAFVADGVAELLPDSQVALLLVDDDPRQLTLARLSSNAERRGAAIAALLGRPAANCTFTPRAGSLLDYCLRTREPVAVHDFARALDTQLHDPIARAVLPDIVRILALESCLALPLTARDECVGLLVVGSRHCLGAGEVERLQGFTVEAALAVSRARHERALLSQQALLEQAYHQLVSQQADAIEMERLRTVGEVASIVAHDFNNALTAILGTAEVAQVDPGLSPGVAERLNVIVRAAGDAARLVAQFRPLCRDEAQPQEPGDLNQLVSHAVSMTESRWLHGALSQGLRIDVRRECGARRAVKLDAPAMRMVIVNLILNAVHALPEGGVITLRTWDSGDRVLLSVADTGCGMSEEVRAHCFDPFYSTSGSLGRGIGLPSARQVVELHGGEIRVTSQVAQGTEFVISLPATSVEVRADVGEPLEAPLFLLPSQPLHALLVDDQPDVRATLREMLLALGHAVTVATSGDEALELFDPKVHSLVLTDMIMPGMSGQELARAIKSLSPTTPVLMLTGQPDIVVPPTVDGWVQKPVSLPVMDRQLRQFAGG